MTWALYSGTHYSCGHLHMLSQQDQTAVPAQSIKWTLWMTENEKRKKKKRKGNEEEDLVEVLGGSRVDMITICCLHL